MFTLIERIGTFQSRDRKGALLAFSLVGVAGLEPATPDLEGRCSIQMSYTPRWDFFILC